MTKQPKPIIQLLYFGDFNCTTGFGNVSKALIDNWSKDQNLRITVFAINDLTPEPYLYKDNVTIIPAYSKVLDNEQKKDVYCRIQFLRLLNAENFDIVFCLNDIEIFNVMGTELQTVKNQKKKENRPNFKSILYFPIDSEPRAVDLKILGFFDECITYTQYAKNIIKPLTTPENWKKVSVIPHGCNTVDFYPFNDFEKRRAKAELLGEENANKFLFGSVNRNSVRKDLASLILGFEQFKKATNPNAVLYLHCNPLDSSGINIFRLCERIGLVIGKDIFLPTNYSENTGCSTRELNNIYNAFDCFVTTTTAEGWGLSVCEAMATKTLVVCPNHTSLTEITEDGCNAVFFNVTQRTVFPNDHEKIRFTSHPNEVMKVLQVIYNIPNDTKQIQEFRKGKIEGAYANVKKMTWESVAQRFKIKIDKLAK